MRWFALKYPQHGIGGTLYVTPGSCPCPLPPGVRIVPVEVREAKPTAKEARAIARLEAESAANAQHKPGY